MGRNDDDDMFWRGIGVLSTLAISSDRPKNLRHGGRMFCAELVSSRHLPCPESVRVFVKRSCFQLRISWLFKLSSEWPL